MIYAQSSNCLPFDFEKLPKSILPQPFLKWAGGKRQLLPIIKKYLPNKYNVYFEPFVGAGALLFDLQPKIAVINDVNAELINCYNVIRDLSFDLIEDLKKHKNDKEYYYKIRELDRTEIYQNYSPVQKASRIIFLNKTCYNGLYRVNKKGFFNVPFGNYSKPNIVNCEVILAINNYLTNNNITIKNEDFKEVTKNAQKGDLIYFDPPYVPLSMTASFTSYSKFEFGKDEQISLKENIDNLSSKGCYVMLSNSATDFVKELYKDYYVINIQANRNINSIGKKRAKIDELIILNYNPQIE